jgi:hypothetical protein
MLKNTHFLPAPLVIPDPFNAMNNISQGTFEMWRVKQAFEQAHTTLFAAISSYPHFDAPALVKMLWTTEK